MHEVLMILVIYNKVNIIEMKMLKLFFSSFKTILSSEFLEELNKSRQNQDMIGLIY